MFSSCVQNLHMLWLVVTSIGVLGSLCGFFHLTLIIVVMPSDTCLNFSAMSDPISGSSHTPIVLSIKPSY